MLGIAMPESKARRIIDYVDTEKLIDRLREQDGHFIDSRTGKPYEILGIQKNGTVLRHIIGEPEGSIEAIGLSLILDDREVLESDLNPGERIYNMGLSLGMRL